MAARPHLWMAVGDGEDAATVRFFLVPRGLRLPDGDLVVRNMQLGTLSVDAEAATDFEVTREAAQAHIDAGWSTAVGQVRDAWNQLLGRPATEAPPDLASWLGITPGEAVVDQEKRRQSGRSLLARAGRLIGQDLDDDSLDRIEGQLGGIRETITREGGKLVESLERAADAAADAVRDATGGRPGPGSDPSSRPGVGPAESESEQHEDEQERCWIAEWSWVVGSSRCWPCCCSGR